jgi:aspartyl-tRNA(Asn)/glutamyl-tRNA(Gln) amidotransferase subunit C
MSVTTNEVERIAALARLSFTPAEKERLTRELNDILSYMETLNAVDTTGVAPLSQVVPLENVFREDSVHPSLDREEILRGAPERSGEAFRVPNVLGDR